MKNCVIRITACRPLSKKPRSRIPITPMHLGRSCCHSSPTHHLSQKQTMITCCRPVPLGPLGGANIVEHKTWLPQWRQNHPKSMLTSKWHLLPDITMQCITFLCIALNSSAVRPIALHCVRTQLQSITHIHTYARLRWHYIPLDSIPCHSIPFHYINLHSIALHCITYHCVRA